jgi:hypothetical protein
MKVEIRLSGSLRALMQDRPAEQIIELVEPVSVQALMGRLNISPLLVMMVLVNGERREKNFMITEDAHVALIGPVAGG